MFVESDLLPLSALQHICFCERQCALIHVGQVWLENRFTAEGRIMHERVDSGKSESRRDVRIAFAVSLHLTEHGRFLARVQGPVSGNVLLRREQYRRADSDDASAGIAHALLVGKLANTRTVLQRAVRDHHDKVDAAGINAASDHLSALLKSMRSDMPLDSLRGMEGDAARIYFSVFDHLIVNKGNGFTFNGRNRRPPLDPINCLLSFIYTLLLHDVRSALESVGLDSAVGYLHRDRPGRPGLALDMMEEFRPVIADRLVLSLKS